METNWAAEHLQSIRTLMERSALYRRALAPIMIFAGVLGLVSAAAGLVFHLDSVRGFTGLWFGTAVAVIAGAFLIARRQALRDNEPFWSPPTRRVAQALLPPLMAGMLVGLVFTFGSLEGGFVKMLAFMWAIFYGCALHAAGFFMPRGMKVFGWIYVGAACGSLCFLAITKTDLEMSAHWLMGFFFGGLHLVYGAYLYLTEKGKNAA